MKTKQIDGQKKTQVARWFGDHPTVIALAIAAALVYVFVVGMNSVKTGLRSDAFGAQRQAQVRYR